MLPLNLEDLVHARAVEDYRREFKATWNDPIKPALHEPFVPSPTIF